MFSFLTSLGLLASQNLFLAYFIIYLATIFLGNISAFASFWIVIRGYMGPWGTPLLILTIFCADFTGDMLWYSLGKALRETRLGNFVRNRLPGREKIEKSLQKNGTNWIYVSKFLYASSFPVIFSVGWVGIGFKKFLKASILSILMWLPILTGLAYALVLGLSPLRATAIFKQFEILFLLGIILFFVSDYFLVKLFKKIIGKKYFYENGNGNGGGNGPGSSGARAASDSLGAKEAEAKTST